MNNEARSLLWLGLVGMFLGGSACERGPQFEYSYKRPAALGPAPDSIALVVPVAGTGEVQAIGDRRARSLAQALGIRLEPRSTVRQVDRWGEILRIRDDRYRLKVYLPSGMIEFRDTRFYNLTLADEERMPALTSDTAVVRAGAVIRRLQEAGLVREDQLPLTIAHVSHRKEQGVRGARQGEQGRPRVMPASAADTRVFIPRVIDGLGVSGNGVRITFTKTGAIAGVDLLWRDVSSARQRLPVKLSLSEARAQFERSARIPGDAVVDVLADELVYFDPSTRDAVAFLEPGYLFVYRVRVPIKDQPNRFRVSKVLHWLIPAVNHGRQQLPSARAARIAEFRSRVDTPRPSSVEPSKQTEEDELPAAVCPDLRAPRAALQVALNEPEIVPGWGMLADSAAPFDAIRNPSRRMLGLRNSAAPFHPQSNPLVYRATCQ